MPFSAVSNPAYNLSRIGANNNVNTLAWDNFVRLYVSEVLTAYHQKLILAPSVRHRTISNGKSTTFPMLGKTTVEYFTPGNEIVGGQIRAGERQVTIDDLLISSQFIYQLDEAMNYYDVRGQYSTEAGWALAKETDRNVARQLIKAALCTDTTTAAALVQNYKQFDEEDFTPNVTIGTLAGDALVPGQIDYAILQAIKNFIVAGIDHTNAICVLPPAQYFALLDTRDSTKVNYMNHFLGGVGGAGGSTVPALHGMPIYCSPNLDPALLWNATTGVTSDQVPLTTAAGGSGRNTAYDMPVGANYLTLANKVCGLIYNPDAVCSVSLQGLQMEGKYQMERQGYLMLSKKAEGHNVLRPANAIALLSV